MSYHYSDMEELPPMQIPDPVSERNALYIILRDFLSHEEIDQRMRDLFVRLRIEQYTNEKAR